MNLIERDVPHWQAMYQGSGDMAQNSIRTLLALIDCQRAQYVAIFCTQLFPLSSGHVAIRPQPNELPRPAIALAS
ncbi:hypothetical protein AS9A_4091 [Hoyosella subflava DQS3-9A1]|uniref:Uncharacterized protein n=1 Tax=Hoyosella subflava (strain DSM 45089 / JCM 17490 / NBRC 109087 / DQS3-9A1) TaxID=443218 RepID=F6EJB0_HOYSD|nr:hypothetical protein AS9A_4091 [Hoyosella subflava DQS3-9A1]